MEAVDVKEVDRSGLEARHRFIEVGADVAGKVAVEFGNPLAHRLELAGDGHARVRVTEPAVDRNTAGADAQTSYRLARGEEARATLHA